MTQTQIMRNDDNEDKEFIPDDSILGYCAYCKNEVFDDEIYKITKSKKIYHQECYDQKHNTVKELRFK